MSNMRTQAEIIRGRTFRERLLAMLGMFFAGVAIVLGGMGCTACCITRWCSGEREIGIRLAVGAQAGRIARLVTADVFLMVAVGAIFGLVLGMAAARILVSLLFEVKATDWTMMAAPWTVLLVTAVVCGDRAGDASGANRSGGNVESGVGERETERFEGGVKCRFGRGWRMLCAESD